MILTSTLLALASLTRSALAARTRSDILNASRHRIPFCDVEAASEAARTADGHLADFLLATADNLQQSQSLHYVDTEIPI